MRLLSYNIHKGIGGRDRRYRLERIIHVIEEQCPDIICLQEVDQHVRRSRFHDQPQLLASHFQCEHHHYQQNVFIKKGGYGNMVISKWPFRSCYQISLRKGRRKPRGAQLVVVQTPEGPLHLVHWHLGLVEKERQWQVRHLLEHMLYHEGALHPTMLVGDTNDWRNRLERHILAKQGFNQATSPTKRFRSFPAYMPMVPVDKLFYREGILVKESRLGRGPLARRASDHLPLIVDFHLSSGAVGC